MPKSNSKRNGIGAKCSVLLRVLHPKKDITARFPNAVKNQRLEGLVAIEQKKVVVNRNLQLCVIFITT